MGGRSGWQGGPWPTQKFWTPFFTCYAVSRIQLNFRTNASEKTRERSKATYIESHPQQASSSSGCRRRHHSPSLRSSLPWPLFHALASPVGSLMSLGRVAARLEPQLATRQCPAQDKLEPVKNLQAISNFCLNVGLLCLSSVYNLQPYCLVTHVVLIFSKSPLIFCCVVIVKKIMKWNRHIAVLF
jgi:hypothetical protein